MAAIRQSRPARAVPATPYPPEQAIHQTPHGASGTPPPTKKGTRQVGANIVRPQTENQRKRPRASTARPYILYFAIENLGPEGVNMENGLKALRKMQHSCIF